MGKQYKVNWKRLRCYRLSAVLLILTTSQPVSIKQAAAVHDVENEVQGVNQRKEEEKGARGTVLVILV